MYMFCVVPRNSNNYACTGKNIQKNSKVVPNAFPRVRGGGETAPLVSSYFCAPLRHPCVCPMTQMSRLCWEQAPVVLTKALSCCLVPKHKRSHTFVFYTLVTASPGGVQQQTYRGRAESTDYQLQTDPFRFLCLITGRKYEYLCVLGCGMLQVTQSALSPSQIPRIMITSPHIPLQKEQGKVVGTVRFHADGDIGSTVFVSLFTSLSYLMLLLTAHKSLMYLPHVNYKYFVLDGLLLASLTVWRAELNCAVILI